MNKYICKIPYSYVRYGTLSCFVYCEDEEEAQDLAYEADNRHSEDYDDSDNDGDTEYNYSDMDIDLEESDVTAPHNNDNSNSNTPFSNTPAYFLAELPQL